MTQKMNLENRMLTFSRSLQISEGLFYGIRHYVDEENNAKTSRIPIEIVDKGVRGQSSEDDADKPGKSSPQVVEFATIPSQCSQLSLSYSIRVLAKSASPHACGDPLVGKAYEDIASAYGAIGGYRSLAELYVWNIANGRFAWRNRFQTDTASVKVDFDGYSITFSPFDLNLEQPDNIEGLVKSLTAGDRGDVEHLIGRFEEALRGTGKPLVVSIEWLADMLPGQEVFPSQEYIREDKKRDDTSRIYAKLPVFHAGRTIGHASMHSQKIGAALRHIDIWHEHSEFGAVAVNPYAGVQETSDVLRDKASKKSFYAIRKNPEEILKGITSAEDATSIPGDVHFFMANLVRGGVFSSAKPKDTKDAKATSEGEEAAS